MAMLEINGNFIAATGPGLMSSIGLNDKHLDETVLSLFTAVVATTTHTTVVTTPYPQNTTPAQQYPGYQPGAPQSGYGTPAGYGGQSMPSAPYQGQPYAVGPPPPYQESGKYQRICHYVSV